MSYNCTVCGDTIVVQIYKGTPWCNQTCEKKAAQEVANISCQFS